MLDVTRLNAYYGSSHILHDIDVSVEEAGRVAILGRNGAVRRMFSPIAWDQRAPTTSGRGSRR